ncbi:MAG: putative porin, partial [Bacteroidota bacterium]
GLRHFVSMNSMENSFFFKTIKVEKGIDKEHIFLGASIFNHSINQEPNTFKNTDLFLEGDVHKQFSDLLTFNARAHIGLLKRTGDFMVRGDLALQTKKAGVLKGTLRIQNYSPTLLENDLYITQTSVWNNSFSKSFETYFKAKYELERLQLSASFEQYLIGNYIFMDIDRSPTQLSEDLRVSILTFQKDFEWAGFHLDNTVALQSISGSNINLPTFYTKHALYYQNRIFRKVLLFQLGFSLKTFESFAAPTFFPITGSFHQQDVPIDFFPYINAFANFKIGKSFRAFLLMENFTNLINNEVYFNTYFYPMFDAQLRFGFRWQLRG